MLGVGLSYKKIVKMGRLALGIRKKRAVLPAVFGPR